jgi:hypothetical protein
MRVHVPAICQASAEARRLERRLRIGPGIVEVRANPTTGNVLVIYDPGVVGGDAVLSLLGFSGLGPSVNPSPAKMLPMPQSPQPRVADPPNRFAQILLWKAAEIAAERLLLALI